MRTLKNQSAFALLFITSGLFSLTSPTAAAPKTAAIHLGAQCLCAQCGFDAQRAMSKLSGVQHVTLAVKDRRLDINYDDAKQSASSLMQSLAKTDLGKESALILPLDKDIDPTSATQAFSAISGVKTVKFDPKTHALFVTFSLNSTVTAAQLENALKGQATHA